MRRVPQSIPKGSARLKSSITADTSLATSETVFRLQHKCPYNELSKQYPEVEIYQWCDNKTEVLEMTCNDPARFEELKIRLIELYRGLNAKVLKRIYTYPDLQMVAKYNVSGFKSVDASAEKNHCMIVYPVTHREGWEWYRALAFSERDLRNLFKDLDSFCTVEVESRVSKPTGAVRDTYVISRSNLVGGLTTKQYQALALAIESGYFRVPKEVTTDQIAKRLGVPSTTLEEHLRKGQSKLLSAIAPYVQLRSRS